MPYSPGRTWPIFNLVLLLVVMTGCHRHLKYDRKDLYRQRIPNSSLVIYEYFLPGDSANTSTFAGYSLRDSATAFSFSADKIDKLPCTYFSTPPGKTKFSMIDLDNGNHPRTPADTSLSPIDTRTFNVKGIPIDVTKYRETYGSAPATTGFMEYDFDSLRESSDSLTFYNIANDFVGYQLPSTVSFAKGNIKIVDSADVIFRIEVEQFIAGKGDIFRPDSPFVLVPNQPVVGMASYWMRPRKGIKVNAVSDYGIFKRIM